MTTVRRTVGGGIRSLLLAVAMLSFVAPAMADGLRVGKAVAANFGFIPLDVGMAQGIFAREGLEIEPFDFSGGAKQQQAMTAGSIDIALGAGTDIAFTVKGAPELAVGSITASPAFLGITVAADSTVRNGDDLKGRKIGVTGPGSLTFWLVEELNRVHGWHSDGAVPVVIGGQTSTQAAAMKTHEIDGFLANTAAGYWFEEQKTGRFIMPVSTYVSDFELFTILASNAIMQQRPDAVRRFLKGWYASIAFMRDHKADAVAVACKVSGFSPAVEGREYDLLMAHFSTDGQFQPKALDKLQTIFAGLKVLDGPLDLTKLTTEQFLPKT